MAAQPGIRRIFVARECFSSVQQRIVQLPRVRAVGEIGREILHKRSAKTCALNAPLVQQTSAAFPVGRARDFPATFHHIGDDRICETGVSMPHGAFRSKRRMHSSAQ